MGIPEKHVIPNSDRADRTCANLKNGFKEAPANTRRIRALTVFSLNRTSPIDQPIRLAFVSSCGHIQVNAPARSSPRRISCSKNHSSGWTTSAGVDHFGICLALGRLGEMRQVADGFSNSALQRNEAAVTAAPRPLAILLGGA